MVPGKSSFHAFLAALQNRLNLRFQVKPLSGNRCLLYLDSVPIRMIYYPCSSGPRVSIVGEGRCIHVDEDTWITRSDIVLSRIGTLMGQVSRIHARHTVAARIEKRVVLSFQEEHHLQVALPGKYRYGLYHDGELVAIAVFSGGRRMDGKPDGYRSYELLRFCHKQSVHVVGGFSKLIACLRRDFNPGNIMTYADKDWSDGSSYLKMGFQIVGETGPQLFWVHRCRMQRYYERTLPPAIREKSVQERAEAGFVACYNSGSIKLVKECSV